jgi:hypothetical protein
MRPRDPRRFQRLHGFSLTINDSNKPGKLLSLEAQIPRIEQMGFGHSSGTVKEQGRELESWSPAPNAGASSPASALATAMSFSEMTPFSKR